MGLAAAFIIGIVNLAVVRGVPNAANVWWLFMTIFLGYLLADVFAFGYERWKKGDTSELWIPFEFVAFFFAILFGAVVGEVTFQWVAHAFDKPDSLAQIAFYALDIGLPVLLFADFYLRGRFRRTRYPTL